MTIRPRQQKLSPTQTRVMDWISRGWGARASHGSAVEINGQRVCNVDTMAALSRHGLVVREENGYWRATDAGRKLCPDYRALEQD